ncbi:MAG: choice-of-anchor tandem repeat GloVer-containing protein [Terriglobales bacterium]
MRHPRRSDTSRAFRAVADRRSPHPITSLIPDGAGNFYGATELGGSCPGWNGYGCGVVYELSPNGSGGWNETVLHTFSGPPDAANPIFAPVVFDRAGNLYGTTGYGGSDNLGAVYELSPAGASWTEAVLYSFGTDWYYPTAGLIMDSAGNLYGTTAWGGDGNCGTVFEMSPSGGGWTEQVIYSPYCPAGSAGLIMDAAGNIFGAAASTVFELSPNGSGGWNPTVIHTFAGAPKDGYGAAGVPVLDHAGNLYGATYSGGTNNYGTVYKLSPITEGKKKGQWEERILHSFSSGKDGANPSAGVVLDAAGNIYGTTYYGGKSGVGTVFELIAPAGTDKYYKEKVLWTFNGSDGMLPYGNPILDSAGNLYGTANEGGSYKFFTESLHLWPGSDLHCSGRVQRWSAAGWRNHLVHERQNGIGNGDAGCRFGYLYDLGVGGWNVLNHRSVRR